VVVNAPQTLRVANYFTVEFLAANNLTEKAAAKDPDAPLITHADFHACAPAGFCNPFNAAEEVCGDPRTFISTPATEGFEGVMEQDVVLPSVGRWTVGWHIEVGNYSIMKRRVVSAIESDSCEIGWRVVEFDSLRSCEPCPAGTQGTVFRECEPCEVGYYSPEASVIEGRSPGDFRSATCIKCGSLGPTRYTDETAATECKTCPEDSHRPVGSPGVDVSECTCDSTLRLPDPRILEGCEIPAPEFMVSQDPLAYDASAGATAAIDFADGQWVRTHNLSSVKGYWVDYERVWSSLNPWSGRTLPSFVQLDIDYYYYYYFDYDYEPGLLPEPPEAVERPVRDEFVLPCRAGMCNMVVLEDGTVRNECPPLHKGLLCEECDSLAACQLDAFGGCVDDPPRMIKIGRECVVCPRDSTRGKAIVVLLAVLILPLIVAVPLFWWRPFLKKEEAQLRRWVVRRFRAGSMFGRARRRAASPAFRLAIILVGFAQILRSFDTSFPVEWPPAFVSLISRMDFLRVSPIYGLPSIRCEFDKLFERYGGFVGLDGLYTVLFIVFSGIVMFFIRKVGRIKHWMYTNPADPCAHPEKREAYDEFVSLCLRNLSLWISVQYIPGIAYSVRYFDFVQGWDCSTSAISRVYQEVKTFQVSNDKSVKIMYTRENFPVPLDELRSMGTRDSIYNYIYFFANTDQIPWDGSSNCLPELRFFFILVLYISVVSLPLFVVGRLLWRYRIPHMAAAKARAATVRHLLADLLPRYGLAPAPAGGPQDVDTWSALECEDALQSFVRAPHTPACLVRLRLRPESTPPAPPREGRALGARPQQPRSALSLSRLERQGR